MVGSIAASTVGRWLRAEKLQPWRYHARQHILDPKTFLERAAPVLRAYDHAQTWLKQGIWVVCLDEKTSIQAREGETPPQAAAAEQPMHLAARYQR